MPKTTTQTPPIPPYPIAPDDPLAAEHANVSAWVEEAVRSQPEQQSYLDVGLKTLASGQRLLDGTPDQSRRHVLAAVAQARYRDELIAQIRAGSESEILRNNPHMLVGHEVHWRRRKRAVEVIGTLLRRTLPLQGSDLTAILGWCNRSDSISTYQYPVGSIARALERHAAAGPLDPDLLGAMREFAAKLRGSYGPEVKRYGSQIQHLCGAEAEAEPVAEAEPHRPAPRPEPAGTAHVLEPLKRFFGMPAAGESSATAVIGDDRFPLPVDSPLRPEHERLGALLDDLLAQTRYNDFQLDRSEMGRAVLAADPVARGRVVLAAAERRFHVITTPTPSFSDPQDHRAYRARVAAATVAQALLPSEFAVDRAGAFDLLLYLATVPAQPTNSSEGVRMRLLAQVEAAATASPLTEGERYALWVVRASMLSGPALGKPTAEVLRLSRLINDGANFYLAAGEAWSDAVNAHLTRLEPAATTRWVDLLKHALGATSGRPSAKWLAAGKKLVDAIDGAAVEQALADWFPLVARGRTVGLIGHHPGTDRGRGDVMNDENATALRGLLWLVQTLPHPDRLARTITALTLSAYKKVPAVGPRAIKVGNAAVYALAELKTPEAVGQLALLKVRVKFGTAQKEIDKAFTTAAAALNLPRDQVEEMGVPSYGLEEVGRRVETLGDSRAELVVTGSDAALGWFDAKGKALKSVPAAVKRDHKDEWKELQESLRDIQAMLPAQRDRVDGLFLAQQAWPIDAWRERYGDHPLVGTIARRLIWQVDDRSVLFHAGEPTDALGRPVAIEPGAQVGLWHPVGRTPAEVVGWRRRLEALGVTQPFKQAHREVYPLTDAERNTRTYSNRFAAHVIRQHQFNALCAARGWKNQLRLMVDDSFAPPTKDLPGWGLRAEFWVEGIGDDYGTDTNETGTYLRLATDQVRFHRTGAATNEAHAGGGGYASAAHGPGVGQINEPIPLDQVPPLVFSEVMRDVDLFVGVASVGNDPTWQDGGPQGRYRAYWQGYSFGELSGTAATRKQVLERLVPRLKIAQRCSFEDRFLRVQGQQRAYKIHLGSGNILMEPNDQYLCIVPDGRAKAAPDDLFLPFEGDSMLSIILSKALLLADETRIKDPTILSQINRR